MYDYIKETTQHSNDSQAKKQPCEAYNKYKNDRKSGSASVDIIGSGSGGAKFSSDYMESVGKYICDYDEKMSAKKDFDEKISRLVSEPMMRSYQQCIRLAKKGLKVAMTKSELDRVITITLSWIRNRNCSVKVKGVNVTLNNNEINCEGELWRDTRNLKNGEGLELDSPKGMQCARIVSETDIADAGRIVRAKPVSFFIETEAESVAFHFPPIYPPAHIDVLKEIKNQLPPLGAYLLMEKACPEDYYIDVTKLFENRFIKGDQKVVSKPSIDKASDGSHSHGNLAHAHSVDLTVPRHPGGSGHVIHQGGRSSDASHKKHQHKNVKGNTGNNLGDIEGGVHTHASVGMRVCKRVNSRI